MRRGPTSADKGRAGGCGETIGATAFDSSSAFLLPPGFATTISAVVIPKIGKRTVAANLVRRRRIVSSVSSTTVASAVMSAIVSTGAGRYGTTLPGLVNGLFAS